MIQWMNSMALHTSPNLILILVIIKSECVRTLTKELSKFMKVVMSFKVIPVGLTNTPNAPSTF